MGWISLEFAIIPALLVLAMLVGLLPAWTAYQTDVAKSLGS
jgi:putative ABC transport system permease protein